MTPTDAPETLIATQPQLIDGKRLQQEIEAELRTAVEARRAAGQKVPHLAAVLVGHDGGSETYVRNKVLACERVGFDSSLLRFEDDITEADLLATVQRLNQDPAIDGILIQLPLPRHIAEEKVIEAIRPDKDVDGFHPVSVGRMVAGVATYLPATPYGIVEMLRRYHIPTEGKHCVVVGRSRIVGLPASILLGKQGNATVTLCHRHTQDLGHFTRMADILVVAVGQPGLIKADMVKPGAVIIDVGTTRVPDATKKSGYALRGDVDFAEVAPLASAITPVPGGVGPMTITMLLVNTLHAAQRRTNDDH